MQPLVELTHDYMLRYIRKHKFNATSITISKAEKGLYVGFQYTRMQDLGKDADEAAAILLKAPKVRKVEITMNDMVPEFTITCYPEIRNFV